MLMRRNVPEFKLDLVWDGRTVLVDYGEHELDYVGDALGPRTANAIMRKELELMYQCAQGMEGRDLL